MANYADYIQFPDTMIDGNYVERYAFPDSTGISILAECAGETVKRAYNERGE